MDIEKAREVSRLYRLRDDLRSSVLTMRSRVERNPIGTTNITIPTSWLPAIIGMAESELSDIDEKISRL